MPGFSITLGNTSNQNTYPLSPATYGGGNSNSQLDRIESRLTWLEQAVTGGAQGSWMNHDRYNNYQNTNYHNGWKRNHCHDGNRMQQWAPPQNNWQYASAVGYQPNNYYDNNQRFNWPPVGGDNSYYNVNNTSNSNSRGFSISFSI